MLESEPFRALSRAAHRVLDRLEIELGHNGGTGNGALKVPYEHFRRYGVDRESIAPAIREVEALRFVEITKKGRGGNVEYRELSEYRLTYRHTDHADPTNEWRSIGSEAPAVAAAARKAKDPAAVARSRRHAERNEPSPTVTQPIVATPSPSAGKSIFGADIPHVPGRKTSPENPTVPGRKTRRSSPGRKTRPTIYISGRDTEQPPREARPSNSAVASGAAATELLERADILQARVAKRLGTGGWTILQHLQPDHLQNLIAMEDRGELTEAVLVRIRIEYLARGAA